jgi:hypothetical protein
MPSSNLSKHSKQFPPVKLTLLQLQYSSSNTFQHWKSYYNIPVLCFPSIYPIRFSIGFPITILQFCVSKTYTPLTPCQNLFEATL